MLKNAHLPARGAGSSSGVALVLRVATYYPPALKRGVVLFGPLGIAAVLASGTKAEGNPCLNAIEAAKTGAGSEKEVQEERGLAAKTGNGIKKGQKISGTG